MARHLFTVEDAFTIRGRGLILVPGIVPEGDERFRVGDRISLRKPDGSSTDAQIGGLELFASYALGKIPVILIAMKKEDVPIGTEVWSSDG